MTPDQFLDHELGCIREAAGRPRALVRAVHRPGGIRSRTYLLEGPDGGTFVKCLDAGFLNPPSTYLTLEHEAAGYRLFGAATLLAAESTTGAPPDYLMAFPEVRFLQSFHGSEGEELQVLGLANLESLGVIRAPKDIYLKPEAPLRRKVRVAAACGRAMARLVSSGFQSSLDRAAGTAIIGRQMDDIANRPDREQLLAQMANHGALPWAYQNITLGEMNVLVPRWLEGAGRKARPETQAKLARIGRVLTDPQFVDALSPGRTLDRVILSPRDRHDGNTLLLMEGNEIRRMYQIDLEFWGLETPARLIGRYAAIQHRSVCDNRPRWQAHGPSAEGRLTRHYRRIKGAFLYHFVRGEELDTPEMSQRAMSVGLAGFHAAIFWLYVAALLPAMAASNVDDALDLLSAPDSFLALAAGYADSQSADEAERMQSVLAQVRPALQPITELTNELLRG